MNDVLFGSFFVFLAALLIVPVVVAFLTRSRSQDKRVLDLEGIRDDDVELPRPTTSPVLVNEDLVSFKDQSRNE